MPYIRQMVMEKANIINQNKKIYGSFAEIGAGQEVVNYFFKAGLASQTVAKSMSAYDMVFSDLIYGKSDRYVCEKRLSQMLEHEYSLLVNRLKKTKSSKCCFFAFANTVAVSTSSKNKKSNHHGWMGVRYQSRPQAPYNEILIHVNLQDQTRLQQYEVLGVLGVNLIYLAFYIQKQVPSMIRSLVDNFEKIRVNIDAIKCQGPDLKKINLTSLNTELLKQNLTSMIVFTPHIQAPVDVFHSQKVRVNLEKFQKSDLKSSFLNCVVIPLSFKKGISSIQDGRKVIVHNHNEWRRLKQDIRKWTDKEIVFKITLKDLSQFLKEDQSSSSGANWIQSIGLFFDSKTRICVKASSKEILSKYQDKISYLIKKKYITTI